MTMPVDRQEIQKALLKAEKKARSGKFKKFISSPIFYPSLLLFNYVFYPLLHKGIKRSAQTFFGLQMKTVLPSGTDIILNGIKSHDSEIRLSKFLTHYLKKDDVFVDVGAHYGYYSLLAASLVGNTGRVISLEPSVSSFHILKENVNPYSQVEPLNTAAGDAEGDITFFEYEGPYAEYNTTVADAYQSKKWLSRIAQNENQVPVIILDRLLSDHGIQKAYIKIDVEGGEAAVIRGMKNSLSQRQLTIAMEYLKESEISHREAAQLLYDQGYSSYAILQDGTLSLRSDIEQYLTQKNLTSDNIIFLKA